MTSLKNLHPDLPSCPNCGNEDFEPNGTYMVLGQGTTARYRCTRGIQIVFHYQGEPGILIWALRPELEQTWESVNQILREVRRFRGKEIPNLPLCPNNVRAHALERNKAWSPLP